LLGSRVIVLGAQARNINDYKALGYLA
jgi:hypothetical protein